jgi:PAS domain S-box-containing protein
VKDISGRKRAEALLSAEKHTLEMIAEGAALPDVLNDLCSGIDEQSPGLMSMVSLVEPDRQHLRPIAGPRVPEGWRRTMTPTAISPDGACCGTAAFRMKPVVVADIASDPLWGKSRDVAMSYGLRACWSAPLVSTTGDMLGTFDMYYPKPRNPGENDLMLIERATQIARIAIERELVRKALRASEQRFRLMVEGVKDYAIFMLDTEGHVTSWNAGAERIKGYREEEILGQHFSRFYPPDEVAHGKPEEVLALATATGRVEHEGWRLRKDGSRFWADVVITALRDDEGALVGFSEMTRDLTSRKQAQEELRRSEAYLAEGQRLSHTGSWAWNVFSGEIFWSREHFRIFGLDPEKIQPTYPTLLQWIHPEDRVSVQQTFDTAVHEKRPYALDCRIVCPDGTIKHIHSLAHPLFNGAGEITEYVGTIIDNTEQHEARAILEQAFEEIKELKDRLYHENVALREEIDRASMFDEIIGSSPVVRAVLSRVAKVAPMDSTVLVTGETGTGKELVARAIHKRSKRAGQAFIAFNCAGIPPSLIASELFGHEKGSFTGAQQRRLGRFEVAEGGTIFLDEIGELPAETQIALLRVIQEREFERVGGSQPIPTDVRVIAATNCDLKDAVAAGTFRLDLFYRLNVFPIEVPPLRERKEDIPMLLEYFIKRYAAKAGKKIKSIDKKTIELFKAYHWPGNIRELQNVIERSVIVCEREIFSLDPCWLSTAPVQPHGPTSTLAERLHDQERKIIESALAESKGRIAGRFGAATKLGIPSSTLESKIRTLGIKKNHFRPDR